MHSSTTEAVRLPPDDENGVTVHPAIRSKLPLKRKVRDGKMRRKCKSKESNNNVNSPKKSKSSPKKKKRVSPLAEGEETRKKTTETAAVEVNNAKTKSAHGNKKKKKKKEVIDYSGVQGDTDGKKGLLNAELLHKPVTPETDPVGKVQNWLLKSQYALPKSKSTPAGLTQRSPHKRAVIKPKTDKSKSHSVGNLPTDKDKVRLQVVYKPPFKFSVKLRKPDKVCVTTVKKPEKPHVPRTGVLVRTVREQPAQKQTVKSAAVAPAPNPVPENNTDNIDSNTHTVQSDLEVLLSESEFLFSDD